MVRYVDAIYRGGSNLPFGRGRTYPIAVRTRWWNKRVSVYKRRGYYEGMSDGTWHEFPNWDLFTDAWEIIEGSEEDENV